ncbi:MAG: ABC transporter permease [Candidatus Omnitrophica bacterium]|nr:MAG: Ribose transport system permease protein RbsC [Candidatus Hinthialibacteria bacterium OLB16]MBE7488474.1 ABC transporter permease [bacterium]MCC6733227.1 ABC transporter permease [Candidatus Omnitrophota bacterium]MCE7908964.1 ABC transporter permease [Candidatus Omnitrophica bacterium COP1]MBV6482394.1 Ribose import permease protein RbsC [bacterium]
MAKLIGISVILCILLALLALTQPSFRTSQNMANLSRQIAFLGIYSMGAGIVILTGGIDLSVGSMMGLVGVLLAMTLKEMGWPVVAGVLGCLAVSLLLGWLHGLLITRVRLQPFIVTLCGLLFYRGITRYITSDITKGFGNEFETFKELANGSLSGLPIPVLILSVLAVLVGCLVHLSVYGRHLYAVGGNEDAARYAGVPVHQVKTIAYVLAAGLTGIAGILVALYTNAVQPASHGQFYELYAIAAAVVGGCSLRGGEGTVIGVLLGASLLQLLRNAVNLVGIPTYLEYAVIGGVILVGAAMDELVRLKWKKS